MEEALAGEIKFVIIACVGIVLIIGWTIAASVKRVSRERSRRELFAYVAEGSITPEQAKELLEAEGMEAVQAGITDAVAWGVVSAKDAESLLRKPEKPAKPAST